MTQVAGTGSFPDIGVYMLDLALWIGGAPPTEVVAFTENAGLPVECFVSAQARLAKGLRRNNFDKSVED